ncbi:MAG: hypothetical protein M1268_04775 [Patescibacteria group bacterium]|nr:hypothetical protein [Patescibacteria group bacterium]
MSENINLVANRRDESLKEKKSLKYFRIIAIFSLLSVFLFAISLFIFKTSLGLTSLKKQEDTLSANMASLSDKTVKLLLVQERIKNISDALKNRSDVNKILDLVTKDMPQNVSVNSLSIGKKKATLIVSSYSLYDINIFLENLQKMSENKKIFKRLIFDTLSIDDKNGKYSLGVSIDLL